MKKTIIGLALLIITPSCVRKPNVKSSEYYTISTEETVTKVFIEGHDYLVYDGYKSGSMCHSESCKCKSE